MSVIARQKNGAVHFAKSIADNGSVTAFVDNKELAGDFDDEVCDKVAAHYDGRKNAGKFAFVGPDGKPTRKGVEGPVVKPADPTPQSNDSALRHQIGELEKQLHAAKNAPNAMKATEWAKRIADLEKQLEAAIPVAVPVAKGFISQLLHGAQQFSLNRVGLAGVLGRTASRCSLLPRNTAPASPDCRLRLTAED
jgi:hypothetical protein